VVPAAIGEFPWPRRLSTSLIFSTANVRASPTPSAKQSCAMLIDIGAEEGAVEEAEAELLSVSSTSATAALTKSLCRVLRWFGSRRARA